MCAVCPRDEIYKAFSVLRAGGPQMPTGLARLAARVSPGGILILLYARARAWKEMDSLAYSAVYVCVCVYI